MKPTDLEPATKSGDSSAERRNQAESHADEPRRPQKPSERAFVVQFDRVDGERSRLHGRVELVASGEHLRFRSLKQLIAFMVDILRRRA